MWVSEWSRRFNFEQYTHIISRISIIVNFAKPLTAPSPLHSVPSPSFPDSLSPPTSRLLPRIQLESHRWPGQLVPRVGNHRLGSMGPCPTNRRAQCISAPLPGECCLECNLRATLDLSETPSSTSHEIQGGFFFIVLVQLRRSRREVGHKIKG